MHCASETAAGKILKYCRSDTCARLPHVVLRLLVCPLVILLMIGMSRAYLLMPDARTILFISFLACTAPASATITQMAQIYERDAEYAGAINIVTTLFCLLTMPVMTELYWVMVT